MSIASRFGLTDAQLADHSVEVRYPDTVAGRVAHIDADFMSYQASAETKDELQGIKPRKTFEEMCARTKRGFEHLRKMTASETYIAHITPSGSNKGGRNDQAVTLPYQGNRVDRERPEFLDAVRHFIGSSCPSMVHLDQEADDGMAQANYAAVRDGLGHLSIIVSKDKDLRMVPGLHWDFDTEEVICVGDSFGCLWIDDTKSSKTLKGWGTKFFWAQCLMGDAADNIQGLPCISQEAMWQFDVETTAFAKLRDKAEAARGTDRWDNAFKTMMAAGRKTKPVGAILTFALLDDCMNDKQCYVVVRDLFHFMDAGFDGEKAFIDFRTQEPTTATRALFGDMLLLWMRRNKDPRDVLAWLREERILT